MKEVFSRFNTKPNTNSLPASLPDLKGEVSQIKTELRHLKEVIDQHHIRLKELEEKDNLPSTSYSAEEKGKAIALVDGEQGFLNTINAFNHQRWYTKVNIVINDDYTIHNALTLLDSGADLSCIREGLVPSQYFNKTYQKLDSSSGHPMQIEYKLPRAYVCSNGVCIPQTFLLAKNLGQEVILGTPFLNLLFPYENVDHTGIYASYQGYKVHFPFITKPEIRTLNELQGLVIAKTNHLNFMQTEIRNLNMSEKLNSSKLKLKITQLEEQFKYEICSTIPNAFWERKRHIVSLPYKEGFDEKTQILTKARPSQMNADYLELCKKEIQDLLAKKLVRKSYSPWSCTAFYVNKAAEKERGVPRLVVNYKPLNEALKWIRYPIPNKKDLLDRLYTAQVFSKFDLKSGYWQIQIAEVDKYKTAFTVPFGHYEWNVMPFGLKNAPSEFQNIMNEIFNPYSTFSIVYIDDILVFSSTIDQHFKHLNILRSAIKTNGLVLSAPKMKLFQTSVRFLGQNISQGRIIPIDRSIEFASKFPDEIKDKNQLQRFLGSLNYIADYYQNLAEDSAVLYDRLKKTPPPWSNQHTEAVKKIKLRVKHLPCLNLANPTWPKIVETDASDKGYGGILKQRNPSINKEELLRFKSGIWKNAQINYSTIKKEMLAIIKCISKFQDDLLNQSFLLIIDCSAAKNILKQDIKNIVSKQIFARWQSELTAFDFEIEYIKGNQNSLPDFLTREFLQDATPG